MDITPILTMDHGALLGMWAAWSRLAWWVSPLQGGDWKALKQYIKEGQAGTSTLLFSFLWKYI